ncbi:MAG: substrate-binding domain-containing protein [Spirochaetaceae bacterium]|jgi:ABC-type sugar transport system substrate-binding protein|nr:substrate-binding domain-containing protein [Spirochaetaceae bacterium]
MKAVKYLLMAVLILAVCTAAFAGGGQAGQSKATAKTGGFKVASHNAVIEGNAYRAVYEDQMTEAVRKLQADGIIGTYATFTSNNDPAVESQQVEQTVNEGYDIIIVNPIAANGLDPIIAKALAAGITYVNADCEYESGRILNVVVDQKEWARIQAEFVIKTLGRGKRVIQFNGIDGNSASEMRNEVWQRELRGAGLEIVRTVAHNWNDTDSKRIMSEIIASGLQYDGIINQEAATGILGAIEEAKVPYPGCITSSEEIAWIRRISNLNKDRLVLPFIVVENPPGIGATSLAIAVNLRQGGQLKDGIASAGLKGNSIYYAPQWIMTYDNMAQRLDSVKSLPDSTSVSSYMTLEQAKAAYFK